MVQRLGLAVALIHEPRVLFLDEPTDGVDPVGRAEIRSILLDEQRRGTTVFINSHLLSEIERLCEKVAILSRGKILRAGTVSDLTDQGLAYRLEAGPLAPEILAAIRAQATSVEATNGCVHLRVPDLERLNACLDTVRAAGHLIRQVAPERSTLEESFIRILEDEARRP